MSNSSCRRRLNLSVVWCKRTISSEKSKIIWIFGRKIFENDLLIFLQDRTLMCSTSWNSICTSTDHRWTFTVIANQTSTNAAAMNTSLEAFTIFFQTHWLSASTTILVSNSSCCCLFRFHRASILGFERIWITFQNILDRINSWHAFHWFVFTFNTSTMRSTNSFTCKTLAISNLLKLVNIIWKFLKIFWKRLTISNIWTFYSCMLQLVEGYDQLQMNPVPIPKCLRLNLSSHALYWAYRIWRIWTELDQRRHCSGLVKGGQACGYRGFFTKS